MVDDPDRRLPIRGISLFTGVYDADETRRIIRAIKEDLGCTTLMLIGDDDVEAQARAGAIALEHDLDIWVRPHLSDRPRQVLLDHLRATAAAAEALRAAHPGRVTLMVGTEFSLTSPGMLPGPREFIRVQVLMRWRRFFDRRITRMLDPMLKQMSAVAREEFRGPVTYGAGFWEHVDWSRFDIVGINLYRLGTDKRAYEERVRALVADHDKPVVVTEFGCGSFRGADAMGPASFRIVNWFADPPRVRDGHVRDESVQADYIGELIDLYASVGIAGCFVFTFVMPDFPHREDPQRDIDTAGFGIVAVAEGDASDWHPKEAYRTVADRYRRKERDPSRTR